MANVISIVINGIDRSDKAFAQSKSNLIALEKVAKTAAISFGVLAANLAAKYAQAAINAADETGRLAQQAGIAVEDFSRLSYATQLAEVDSGTLQSAVRNLSQEMVKTGNGSASVVDEILKVSDQFAAATDGAQKTALAVQAFGKSGQAMIPFLNQGSEAIRGQMQEADRLGLTIGAKFAANADQFNDNMERMKLAFKGLSLQIVEEALPSWNRWSEAFLKLVQNKDKSKEFFDSVTFGFRNLTGLGLGMQAGAALLDKFADSMGIAKDAASSKSGGGGGLFNPEHAEKAKQLQAQIIQEGLRGLSQLTGAENLAHQKRLEQIAEFQVADSVKNGLLETQSSVHQQRLSEIFEQGLGARAQAEELFRSGNIEGYTRFLQSQANLDLLDLERRREIMRLKGEAFEQSHKTELQKEAKHLQQMANLRQNWASASATAFGQLAAAAEAFGKKQNDAQKVFATASVIFSTAQAIMKCWADFGWPMGAVFGAIAGAAGAAQIANINKAHGGLDYVPEESTFLLSRGERVIQPEANRDLTEFLDGRGGGGGMQHVTLEIDGHTFAEYIYQATRDGRMRIHSNAIV
jgi:hypothetical protein